ncbi:MAG TPA: ATP-binding protein [Longimicrobiales bacterium]|nr:ATP-binding protein [Longimicrobiales bacterium]
MTGILDALPSRGPISRAVVDGLPVPVMLTDAGDDGIVHVNPEFTATYGHAPAAVEGTSARRLHFVEEDRDLTIERHAQGEIESVEVRLRSADGECLWARADLSRFELDGVTDVLFTTFYDIGALKAAEASARKGEALVAEMARFPEMNPGPVLRLDLDGIVRRSNRASRRLMGDDVEGRCFWDICPDFPVESRRRVLEAEGPVREDVRAGELWLRLSVTHAAGTDQIFVFGTDVTAEKAAEQELADRARFPAMNPGAVARVSAEGIVIRANPAASHVFEKESIAGLSWLELCPGIDEVVWHRVRSGTGVVQHESEIGDRVFSFTLRHEPTADQVFVYGSDVTELKAAERALAELARFPDMNPGPVCRLDRRGRVLLANPAAKAVFGGDGLNGANWLELVPGAAGAFWERLVGTNEPMALEARVEGRQFVLTHAPGPEGLFVFVYGSDVTREREAERALRQSEKMATLGTLAAGVAHELNNPAAAVQRAAEQVEQSFASVQAARAALADVLTPGEANRIVAELDGQARRAAVRGCDLDGLARSDAEAEIEEWLLERGLEEAWQIAPILVEGGFDLQGMEALRDRVGTEAVGPVAAWHAHAQQVYRLLDEIRHGASRLSEIIGAMKAYSHLGQAPVQDVDVNEGIRSTLVILRSKLKGGIVVHQDLDSDLPRIQAHGGELNQVWTNLIDNAVDAMGGEGEIRLRSRLVGTRVVVEVEDSGPGIPVDAQSRVFDAFFTTKPPGQGTGLGLNTSYNIIVDKHGGEIRLDSEPGRTCFTVELPLRRAAEAPTDGSHPTRQDT